MKAGDRVKWTEFGEAIHGQIIGLGEFPITPPYETISRPYAVVLRTDGCETIVPVSELSHHWETLSGTFDRLEN